MEWLWDVAGRLLCEFWRLSLRPICLRRQDAIYGRWLDAEVWVCSGGVGLSGLAHVAVGIAEK